QLGGSRTRTACRLHALLAELVPGGSTKKIKAHQAEAILVRVRPATPAEAARHALALEHLDDLRRVDEQLVGSKKRLADAVVASKTSVTEITGIGAVVAAMVIGYSGDIARFADR